MNMKTKVTLATCLTLCLVACPGYGDIIVPLARGGMDSGWDAVLADNVNNGIVIDAITDEYIVIEIAKIFPPAPAGSGQPTTNVIGFRQRLDDAHTLTDIRIADEIIFNNTGTDWLDYRWEIDGQGAAFDRLATEAGGFAVSPFTNMTWGPSQVGWDIAAPDIAGDHPGALHVKAGLVPDRGVYLPGSGSEPLFIAVDLGRLDEKDSDFDLVQGSTPEPATAAVIAVGGLIVLTRRRRPT